jgi:hypothetical protein
MPAHREISDLPPHRIEYLHRMVREKGAAYADVWSAACYRTRRGAVLEWLGEP